MPTYDEAKQMHESATEIQRQQNMAMAQQSMMGSDLGAALQDEGIINKVGGGIGSVARGLIGLPRQ